MPGIKSARAYQGATATPRGHLVHRHVAHGDHHTVPCRRQSRVRGTEKGETNHVDVIVKPVTARTWSKLPTSTPKSAVSTYSNELYGKATHQSKPRQDYLPLSARTLPSARSQPPAPATNRAPVAAQSSARPSGESQPHSSRSKSGQNNPSWHIEAKSSIISDGRGSPAAVNRQSSSQTEQARGTPTRIEFTKASVSGAVAHKRVSSFAPSSLESSAHHQGRSGQLSACTPRTSNSEPARLGQEQPGKSFHHHLEGKPSSEISSLLQQALHQRDFVRLRKLLLQPGPFKGMAEFRVQRQRGTLFKPTMMSLYLEGSRGGDPLLTALCKKTRHGKSKYLFRVGGPESLGPPQCGALLPNTQGTEFSLLLEEHAELAAVGYRRSPLGSKGPRKISAALPLLDGATNSPVKHSHRSLASRLFEEDPSHEHMVLMSREPRWNDMLQAYCLNFGGRVTEASVKNFQLVAPDKMERTILQFGRVGEDSFTMDFAYPMTTLQAFAICLTSFGARMAT